MGACGEASLVPRPRPAFCCLQYGKAGRAWYLFSHEHDVLGKWWNFQNKQAVLSDRCRTCKKSLPPVTCKLTGVVKHHTCIILGNLYDEMLSPVTCKLTGVVKHHTCIILGNLYDEMLSPVTCKLTGMVKHHTWSVRHINADWPTPSIPASVWIHGGSSLCVQ